MVRSDKYLRNRQSKEVTVSEWESAAEEVVVVEAAAAEEAEQAGAAVRAAARIQDRPE